MRDESTRAGGELDMNADTLKNFLTAHMQGNQGSSLLITKMRLA